MAAVLAACLERGPAAPEPSIVDVRRCDAGANADAAAFDAAIPDYDEPFDAPAGYFAPACASACANLKANRCPEGSTRPGEDSCYIVCRRAEATRGRVDFKPGCIAAAQGREAIRACGTYRCLDARP